MARCARPGIRRAASQQTALAASAPTVAATCVNSQSNKGARKQNITNQTTTTSSRTMPSSLMSLRSRISTRFNSCGMSSSMWCWRRERVAVSVYTREKRRRTQQRIENLDACVNLWHNKLDCFRSRRSRRSRRRSRRCCRCCRARVYKRRFASRQ